MLLPYLFQVDLISQKAHELSQEGRPVKRLSLIGYSLGGIMQRYVAGKLYTLGWFGPNAGTNTQVPVQSGSRAAATIPAQQSQKSADAEESVTREGQNPKDATGKQSAELVQPVAIVEPVNWVSIATPHLGSWRLPTTWFMRTFNGMVSNLGKS
jgi:hypothetical protein